MGATESTEAGAQQQKDKPAVVPSALVLCGPSGVGKGTVISRLMHDEEHFGFSCSHTTRNPRAGEEVSPLLASAWMQGSCPSLADAPVCRRQRVLTAAHCLCADVWCQLLVKLLQGEAPGKRDTQLCVTQQLE